jgi:hypothetical protein
MSKILASALFTLFLVGAMLVKQSYCQSQASVLHEAYAPRALAADAAVETKSSLNLLALVMAPTLNTLRIAGQVSQKEEEQKGPGINLLADWPLALRDACLKMVPSRF